MRSLQNDLSQELKTIDKQLADLEVAKCCPGKWTIRLLSEVLMQVQVGRRLAIGR